MQVNGKCNTNTEVEESESPKILEEKERRVNEVEVEVEGSLQAVCFPKVVTHQSEQPLTPGASASAERFPAANRWPQQETLALLRIRSLMDDGFRQPGNKTPLWDQVSRKMAELGYDRSAMKCKEKFENIYKYHKRLKSCSYSRPNGKTYRFFDQLEALDHHQASVQALAPEQVDTASPTNRVVRNASPISMLPPSVNFDSSPATTSTSISYNSGSEFEGSRKKKRKWEDFFGELMKSVLAKQEDSQRKFLEAIDKCEKERMVREEEWKAQQMARIKREQDLLMQERAISAAKDAAILAFLQKVLEQREDPSALGQMEINRGPEISMVCRNERDPHPGENSCSRWPKEEVEALIRIRSNIDLNDQGGRSKGSLWEEISMAMNNMGYKRSAKRCKEKWENINKYYRRVKDSNKQRPVDSKTCRYFHLLDALYSMRTKRLDSNTPSSEAVCNLRPEELLMHMMNHDPSRHMQEQELQQQENGQLIMPQESSHNGNHSHNEDEDEDEDEHVECGQGDYQSVVHYPHVGIME